MEKPTQKQIKEFWMWCGLKEGTCGWLYDPNNRPDLPIFPALDLNNLFKYEHLTEKGYVIKTHTYKRKVEGVMGKCSWVTIEDPKGKVVTCWAKQELEDALFWAIWEVIKTNNHLV